jgi:hypothetical protein
MFDRSVYPKNLMHILNIHLSNCISVCSAEAAEVSSSVLELLIQRTDGGRYPVECVSAEIWFHTSIPSFAGLAEHAYRIPLIIEPLGISFLRGKSPDDP